VAGDQPTASWGRALVGLVVCAWGPLIALTDCLTYVVHLSMQLGLEPIKRGQANHLRPHASH
jgi:hypothetical protein